MIRIPAGILTARLLAGVVSDAGAGNIDSVFRQGRVLILVILGMLLLEIGGGSVTQMRKAKALHRCKLYLYQQIAVSPLASFASPGHGDTIERLNDDFNTVTGKIVDVYSEWITGIITFILYFLTLLVQSWNVAALLLGMSLLQMLPPIIVKKYLQVNYDNCRDIEAQLTDFVVGGCEGFSPSKCMA